MVTVHQRGFDRRSLAVTLAEATAWNSDVPVSRLPPEILVHIFINHARSCHHNSCDTDVPQWVNVSYVCRRWRHVALDSAILWSHLFLASPSWTRAALIRSNEAPLSVRLDISSLNMGRALDFMEQVAPHAERFQECYLNFTLNDAQLVLSMLCSRPAPLLHTLEINVKNCPYPPDVDKEIELEETLGDVTRAVGKHAFFAGNTPALRELHLRDYRTTWCSPELGGLTALRLRNLNFAVRPTIGEVRTILERMPGLKQLYLENAIRGGRYDLASLPHDNGKKVHLTQLSYFSIAAPLSRLGWFLSCVDVPATTQVRLWCRVETYFDADDHGPFYDFLSQRFSGSENQTTSTTTVRTMVMQNLQRRMSIIFNASDRDCDHRIPNLTPTFEDCDCNILLKVHLIKRHGLESDGLIVGICRSVALARLKSVVLDSCSLPPDFWPNLGFQLGNLRCIEMHGGDFLDILTPLSKSLLARNAGDKHTRLFAPALEELHLERVTIPQNLPCDGIAVAHRSYMSLFCRSLAKRKAMGHGLKQLMINADLSLKQLNEVPVLMQIVQMVGLNGDAVILADEDCCEDCLGDDDSRHEASQDL